MMKNLFKNIDEAPVDSLNLSWDKLEIHETLLKALRCGFNFPKMTPVQAAAIPLMLKNKDVIVEAKTGSGKTLAFVIPVVEGLIKLDEVNSLKPHDVLAIILSPTRELASQIHQELRKLLKNLQLSNGSHVVSQLLVGGSTVAADMKKYAKHGANIIVATPGRLSTILEMADNNLSSSIRKKLSFLILDEADQLLSLGFEQNLSSILAYLPKQRRTSLFSATQTSEVDELIKSGLRNPIKVNINQLDDLKNKNQLTLKCDMARCLPMPDKLTNYYYVCESYVQKLAVLHELIRTDEYKKVLVFLSTCSQIDYFSLCFERLLKDKKITILKLHRRLKNKRKAIFKQFKSTKRCILLVTDILSRGIDIPDISCVVHLDLPTSPECYVHRSGRSGHQLDLSGVSLLLIERHEQDYVEMCRRRQIVLQPMNLAHLSNGITEMSIKLAKDMRDRTMKDSDVHTLGIQAFVSFIRFYSSKLCLRQVLFPRVSIADLVKSYGLHRVPKMPELRKNLKRIEAEIESTPKMVDANVSDE